MKLDRSVTSPRVKIDFVSDIACPWCIIGLKSLEQALDSVSAEIEADIHFHPFEINPQMPEGGQDVTEHLAQKYGATPEQSQRTREAIRQRGEAVGFLFSLDKRSRIYNTFDAHRMLHWAGLEGKQLEFKHALFKAYFTDGLDPGNSGTLVRLAGEIGLDQDLARQVIETNAYADEVREQEAYYQSQGIHSVPAVILNDRHLIQGGQPPDVFEKALRQIANL